MINTNIQDESLPNFDRASDLQRTLQFAVTVPLTKHDGKLFVVFEKRAKDLERQPGEICFPGGMREEEETARENAVRELKEELLLKDGQIRMLAQLDTIQANFGGVISVFLCVIDGYDGKCSKDEVYCTFEVPLDFFLKTNPDEYETRTYVVPSEDFPVDKIPGGKEYPRWRRKETTVFYNYEEWVIWGLTGKIMKQTAEILNENRSAAAIIASL